LPATGLNALRRIVDNLLRLILLGVIYGERLPFLFAGAMFRGRNRAGAARFVRLDDRLSRCFSPLQACLEIRGRRRLRRREVIFQGPPPLGMLFVQSSRRFLELLLSAREFRRQRRRQHPFVLSTPVGKLLQSLHQLQFTAGGKTSFVHAWQSRCIWSTSCDIRAMESKASLTTGPRGSK
jgi:hypothetical protein